MTINQVLHQVRQSNGNAFRFAYVRSSGKSIGSVGSGTFVFAEFIDTNKDLIKVTDAETGTIKTLKISHLLSYNNKPIKR